MANNDILTANSSLTTDFNQTPYYDDFDSTKNYHKILFKPGYAVQARELTQIQSILQDQIQKFGQHVFKEGSSVIGGKFNIDKRVPYVKIKDNDINGNTFSVSSFVNEYITGSTSGLTAYVSLVVDGTESSQNTKTLYITYQNSDPTTNTTVFSDGEILVSNVGSVYANTSNSTGYGSIFTINEGVRFAKEHFIQHKKQSVVIDRYGQSPTCRVGLLIDESIINADQDASLLDPALESSNYSAPGADRFKLTPTLIRVDSDQTLDSNNYVNLFDIKDGIVQEVAERPIYNIIADEIAKRTMDESGDYYVNGLGVEVMEHLNTANNGGYLTVAEGGDANNIVYKIEPGLAYVKGYEVNNEATKYVVTNKANTYTNVNSQVITTRVGTYVLVNEAVGAWNLNLGQKVYLYDAKQNSISSGTSSSGAPTGNSIGSARVKSLTRDTGSLGTASANLKLHLFDVNMLGSNSFSNVRSVFSEVSGSANVKADVITSALGSTIKDPFTPLIYGVGSSTVRKIRSTDDVTIDTIFTFKKTTTGVSISSGTFTISTSSNEYFPYGSGSFLTDTDKLDLMLTLTSGSTISLGAGTTTGTGSSNTLVSGTIDFTRLNVGDRILLSGNSKNYIITGIANSTHLTVDSNLPSNVSGNTLSKVYLAGDMIDLGGLGSTAGAERTVYATSDQLLTIDLKEALTATGTISYNVTRTAAKEANKILKTGNYVKINVALAGTTTGPFNLGVSDVFRVKKIIKKTGSFPTNTSDGTDITKYFNLDSGQRDSYYTHGSIKPVSTTLSSTDRLLVELDYFVADFSTGVGYFSVDSYPASISIAEIPKYISDSGVIYDLRNSLDFRPVYENTATETTDPSTATINPAAASTLKSDGSCLRIPAESEQATFDFSYYLPRIDILAINSKGDYVVIQGTPSETPRTPKVSNDFMSLARILVQAYPSISMTYAKQIGRSDLGCVTSKTSNIRYTMKDIGLLKNRVDQLEKYVSLNLLEKTTTDLKILDENGLDRFKNGIFVDSFSNQSLAAFFHPDHHISYDFSEKTIRPLFEMVAMRYDYLPLDGDTSNVVRTGDYVTLPYTETTLFSQPFATTNRNVENSVYRFIGRIYMTPDSDFWINAQKSTDVTIVYDSEIPYYTPYSVNYGSWQVTTGGDWKLADDKGYWGNWYGLSSVLQNMDPDTQIQYYYDNDVSTWLGYGNYLGTGYSWAPTVSEVLGKSTTSTLGTYAKKPGTGYTGGISPSDLYAVTTQSRTRTETFQELLTEYTTSGETLTNVTPIADIRPQVIAFQGTGLKANTRHYVFFDGIKMSDYVTPSNTKPTMTTGIVPVSGETYSDPPANRQFDYTTTGAEGSDLISDRTGNVYGLLRIPADGSRTFKTGTKEIVITDSITNEEDATSVSKGYFVAQGLQQTRQQSIIATKKVITRTKTSTETSSSILLYDRVSCMAYTFIPKVPPTEDGVFLTSFEVFFQSKDPTLGVWFEIRECDNSGNITRTQIPGSEVWLTSDQVNVSDDSKTETVVRFPTPIFLRNDTEYALVIHTQGINPNYNMWCAVLGDNDIATGRKFNERSLTGTLYTTNNNLDWDIVPRTDLKVRFLRAKFNTGVIGSAVFGNEAFERIRANTVSATFNSYGEQVSGRDRILLSGATATPIASDFLIGANTGVNTSILTISGSEYRMSGFGYSLGETVTIQRSNGVNVGVATISTKNTSSAIVYDYISNINENIMDVRWSNGKFIQGETLTGLSSNNTLVVEKVEDFVYSTVQFEPSYLRFTNTDCLFSMKTVSNTGSYGGYASITPRVITDFSDERRLYSKSNETVGTTNRFRSVLSSSSEYVSPVIDVSKSYTVYVHNKINSNSANELSPTGGKFINQYLSQVITLAEGQDAEDLRIILSAYRPPGSNSDFHVYVRYSNTEDTESIQKRDWIKMVFYDNTIYSSLSNKNDFIEYSMFLPDSVLTGTDGYVTGIAEYTNSANATFTGFKQFQLKIALQSDNSAVVPRVRELRAIALQK